MKVGWRKFGPTFPAYFLHEGTGVTVEVEEDAVITWIGNEPGEARPFSRMMGNGQSHPAWGPDDEVRVLTGTKRTRWKAL